MCITLKINMSDKKENISIKDIVNDIEQGELTSQKIIEKYSINAYKYNKILKIAEIKKPYCHNADNKKPKRTKFKKMLTESDVNTEDSSFDIEGFKEDCKKGVKISELMDKYKLSLYQVRELRKRYDLKSK